MKGSIIVYTNDQHNDYRNYKNPIKLRKLLAFT